MAMHNTRRQGPHMVVGMDAERRGGRRRTGGPGKTAGTAPERLAHGLGWLSVGLGLAALVTPRRLARSIGVPDGGLSTAILRLVGLRELASGLGILAGRRPAVWLRARVAGDVMDLALLGTALTSPEANRKRVAAASAAVAGVTVLDVLGSRELSGDGVGIRSGAQAVAVRRAITINRPADSLYRCRRDFTNLPRFMRYLESVQVIGERRSHWKAKTPAGVTVEWDAEIVEDRPNELIAWRTLEGAPVQHSGVVRFQPAPGGRGTEVIAEMEYRPPGGAPAAKIAKLLGQAPEQLVQEDLRRFKQLMETGEIPVSEALLSGVAQPPRGEAPAVPAGAGGWQR